MKRNESCKHTGERFAFLAATCEITNTYEDNLQLTVRLYNKDMDD